MNFDFFFNQKPNLFEVLNFMLFFKSLSRGNNIFNSLTLILCEPTFIKAIVGRS